MKLDPHEIGLVVVFREFIKAQKLGLRSNFSAITPEEFNAFWSKQSSSKRRSSESIIAALLHSLSPQLEEINHLCPKLISNLEASSLVKKLRSTNRKEFVCSKENGIGSKEVLDIFKGLCE